MEEYDVLVVGSEAGMNIASRAVNKGEEDAPIDRDPLGGTCLNRGCISSKVMVYPADVIQEAKEAEKLGVDFSEIEVDFQRIMERTRMGYLPDRRRMKERVEETEGLTFYNDVGKFVDDYTREVSGEEIRAEKIFLFSGARPLVPPIDGIEETDYLTNRNIFEINEKPESMIIIGGGYTAVEFAHFLDAVGTDVTILEQMDRLFTSHDPEISALLEEELSSRAGVRTNHRVTEIGEGGGSKFAVAENTESGEEVEIDGGNLLVATVRRSNADLLEVENTGVGTDERGGIIANEYLETTKENIWVGGDATGEHMFRHVANYEAAGVWHNAFTDHKMKLDYHAVPPVVFTRPQIASVGMTVEEAKEEYDEVLVGRSEYKNTAKGYAMGQEKGFCKILINPEDGVILGPTSSGHMHPC